MRYRGEKRSELRIAVEPPEAAGLSANGVVAEGRLQKYFGFENGWPISSEPITLPSLTVRLPLAARGNSSWPIAVVARGYAIPVMRVSSRSSVTAGRSKVFMARFL